MDQRSASIAAVSLLILLLFDGGQSLQSKSSDDVEVNRASGSRLKRQVSSYNPPWTNNTVFYEFDDSSEEKARDIVKEAMAYIAGHTCIDFREDPSATNRIRIKKGEQPGLCASTHCGMKGGVQELVMGDYCKVEDTIHEIIHALGVQHMQKRYDRDNYIKVNLSSFKTDADKDQLKKMQPDQLINYTPYEYGSIMHYRADSWIDDSIAITPLDPLYTRTMGSPIPSFYDLMMLNMHYKCNAYCESSNKIMCTNGGVLNPIDCKACICPYGYGGKFCDERPAGCGKKLKAFSFWKSETFSFDDTSVPSDHNRKMCNHWIEAPLGRKIVTRVTGLPTDECKYGCTVSGIEPKISGDNKITNPRYCCGEQLKDSREQISELNPTPIFSYSKHGDSKFTFEYKYI